MDSLVIAIISALIGGGVGGWIAYYSSLRLLSKQFKAQTYGKFSSALLKLNDVAIMNNPPDDLYMKVKEDMKEAYGQLLFFGDDDDLSEFRKIFDEPDVNIKFKRFRDFIIRLRKKVIGKTKLTSNDIHSLEIVRR